jgi:hypothetical protein
MADNEFTKTHRDETYKSLVPLSIEAMKMAVFLNGGAAVALMAFLGNVVPKGGNNVPALGPSLRLFAGGAVLGGIAFASAYLCQLALYNETIGRGPQYRGNPPGTRFLADHRGWLCLTFGLVMSSLGCFFRGCLIAASEFPF